MLERTRPLVAVRLVAGAAVIALAVAACGGSSSTPAPSAAGASGAAPTQAAQPQATPAPTAPPEEPSESAESGGGGGTAGGCADMATVAAALKNVDHYVATATVSVAIPGASADAGGLAMDMSMKFQKPDRFEISTGMGGGVLFAMRQVGKESWLQMFGSDKWTKSDSTTGSTGTDSSDLLGQFNAANLEPLAQIPDDLDLPGSSSCVIGYTMKTSPTGATGDSSNPLSSISSASAIALRVDTATNLPQSMGFKIDVANAGAGAPTSMVFVFDYQTPVDIQAPDPSQVSEGGALDGFALPSGLDLPSGLTLP